MATVVPTYLLFGFYFAPFAALGGFLLAHGHVRLLAKRGGEQRYPEPIQRVVRKYRQEKYEEGD